MLLRRGRAEELSVGALSGEDDKELTLAFQRGDDDAYRAIYELHQRRVASICRRMLGNVEEAREAEQEAFLRVYTALGRFNGRYQLGAWIARIATNVCLDHLRSRSRRPAIDELEIEELSDAPLDDHTDPESVHLRRFEARRIGRVLQTLPPMHRAALVLRELEGLSYAEIAVALEITECQVKALLHRARNNFKRSWTSGLAALLPWRLVQRLRGVDAASRESAAQALSSTAPTVTTCSTVLQQCGQFVAERAVAVATAAGVGLVATVGAIAPQGAGADVARPVHRMEKVVQATALQEPPVVESRDQRREVEPDRVETIDTPVPTAEAETPTASEEPPPATGEQTNEAPPQSEPQDPAPQPSPSPSASPEPASAPEYPAVFGWSNGTSEVPSTTDARHSETGSCWQQSLSHSLHAPIWRAGEWHGASLTMSVSQGRGQFSLVVRDQDGKEFHYSSWGAEPVAGWHVTDRETLVTLEGDYGPRYGSDPASSGLPSSGSFRVELTLDCSTTSVVTESVVLTE